MCTIYLCQKSFHLFLYFTASWLQGRNTIRENLFHRTLGHRRIF